MKNGLLFLLGLFAAVTVSWAAIVLGSHAQLGALAPYYDDAEGHSFPQRTSGVAAQGQLVYADLGCVACHTQQVRRPDFGSDEARGWGERQSVARDYIFQVRPQLGTLRLGPDLTNLAARKPSEDDLLKLLYEGSPTHPSYRFLFETRDIVGQRSEHALTLTGNLAVGARRQVVASDRAQALVAYLMSLDASYVYPEARPVAAQAEKAEKPAAHGTPAAKPAAAANTEPSPATEKSNPPGKRPEQAVPAAAPDEKKKSEVQKK
jgi:cytochrome c oxidase cbb3-type subunit II